MKKTKVIITGGTGFTGNFVVQKFLTDPSFVVSLLVRDRKKALSLGFSGDEVKIHLGSFEDEKSMAKAFAEQDVLVNIASLGFGHGSAIVNQCLQARISKAVFVSTTSIFTKLNPASKTIRLAAERLIGESGLAYTIVRPTMIIGTTDDRNICRLIQYIQRFPILPIPGPGTSLIQPVFVQDIADAIYQIVKRDIFSNKAYNLSGGTVCSFNELIDMVSTLLEKKVLKLHVPLGLMKAVIGVYEKMFANPRIKVEQLVRLNEEKNFSYKKAENDFGYAPHQLEEVLRSEVDAIVGR